MVEGLKHKKYQERLNILNLTTLEKRRARGDLIETFKLLKGKEDIDFHRFFQLQKSRYNLRGTAWHCTFQMSEQHCEKAFSVIVF